MNYRMVYPDAPVIVIDSPGPTPASVRSLPFQRMQRPFFPLDDDHRGPCAPPSSPDPSEGLREGAYCADDVVGVVGDGEGAPAVRNEVQGWLMPQPIWSPTRRSKPGAIAHEGVAGR